MTGLLFSLLYLPVLVAQWIGVVAIGKARRGGAWWCMLIGVIVLSFGAVAGPILNAFVLPRIYSASSWGSSGMMMIMMSTSLVSGFGSLLFMVGFVMHALGFRRTCERVAELEMVIEAQNEQLSR